VHLLSSIRALPPVRCAVHGLKCPPASTEDARGGTRAVATACANCALVDTRSAIYVLPADAPRSKQLKRHITTDCTITSLTAEVSRTGVLIVVYNVSVTSQRKSNNLPNEYPQAVQLPLSGNWSVRLNVWLGAAYLSPNYLINCLNQTTVVSTQCQYCGGRGWGMAIAMASCPSNRITYLW